MNELFIFLQFIISLLFLSASIGKLRNIEEHIYSVSQYKLLPSSITRLMGWTDSLLEFIIAIFLLFGFFTQVTLIVLFLLIISYTIAITINLFKKRTDIDCGCGGITGNHKISWYLIIRNLIIISIILLLIINIQYSVQSISLNTLFIFFVSLVTTVFIGIIVEFITIQKQLKKLI